MLNAARAMRTFWREWRGSRSVRLPPANPDRKDALTAAIEPLGRAVSRLGDPVVLTRLAAALPPEEMWKQNGGARWNGLDTDLNAAMAPLRWRALLAAEHAGAAHQIDATPAIWAWEVDDPTWRAALDAIDVAMAVSALQSEGLPVTTGMREAHRQVLEVASEQAADRA
jgi:hypothetical protein